MERDDPMLEPSSLPTDNDDVANKKNGPSSSTSTTATDASAADRRDRDVNDDDKEAIDLTTNVDDEAIEPTTPTPVKRGRGRPRKHHSLPPSETNDAVIERVMADFSCPATSTTTTDTPVRKGRGRPRKAKTTTTSTAAAAALLPPAAAAVEARHQDRQRAHEMEIDLVMRSTAGDSDAEHAVPVKRGQGRPSKSPAAATPLDRGRLQRVVQDFSPPARQRGRPRKSDVDAVAVRATEDRASAAAAGGLPAAVLGRVRRAYVAVAGKRRRGRPPKNADADEVSLPAKRRRGRPPKNADADEVALPAKRRRGRPPKNADAEDVSSPAKRRRRGRPPKSATPEADGDGATNTLLRRLLAETRADRRARERFEAEMRREIEEMRRELAIATAIAADDDDRRGSSEEEAKEEEDRPSTTTATTTAIVVVPARAPGGPTRENDQVAKTEQRPQLELEPELRREAKEEEDRPSTTTATTTTIVVVPASAPGDPTRENNQVAKAEQRPQLELEPELDETKEEEDRPSTTTATTTAIVVVPASAPGGPTFENDQVAKTEQRPQLEPELDEAKEEEDRPSTTTATTTAIVVVPASAPGDPTRENDQEAKAEQRPQLELEPELRREDGAPTASTALVVGQAIVDGKGDGQA